MNPRGPHPVPHDKSAFFLPIDIETSGRGKIVWADVSGIRFTEAYFQESILKHSQGSKKPKLITTGLGALKLPVSGTGVLHPTGFIFHMSRCGSTAISRALSRARSNILISEPYAVSAFLSGLRGRVPKREDMGMFRNLIFTFGRKRNARQKHYFVKFTSWNVLFVDFIRSCFPDVPWIFVYRDPIEVFVSVQAQPTGFAVSREAGEKSFFAAVPARVLAKLSQERYVAKVLKNFIDTALAAPEGDKGFVRYDMVNAQGLRKILRFFNCAHSATEFAAMARQFKYDSIDNNGRKRRFKTDGPAKQDKASPRIKALLREELRPSYQKLETSGKNLKRD